MWKVGRLEGRRKGEGCMGEGGGAGENSVQGTCRE